MAQSGKRFTTQVHGPESDPQNLHKTLGILVCIGNLTLKAAEAKTLGVHWPARPSLIGESQSPVRDPVSEINK